MYVRMGLALNRQRPTVMWRRVEGRLSCAADDTIFSFGGHMHGLQRPKVVLAVDCSPCSLAAIRARVGDGGTQNPTARRGTTEEISIGGIVRVVFSSRSSNSCVRLSDC